MSSTATIDRPTALVTGATPGGIGAAFVLEFAEAGYHVFATARRPEVLEPLLAASPHITALPLDVTVTASVASCVSAVRSRTNGSLNVLVNNAGISTPIPASDADIDTSVRELFEANVFGLMRVTQGFIPLLIAAQGTVVNIGSIAPILNLPFSTPYCASKAAVRAYGDGLRMEMEPFGVGVLTILTGGVRSNIVKAPNRTLPEGSLYKEVEDGYQARVNVSQSSSSMDNRVFARGIVGEVKWHGGRKREIWRANYATIAWIIERFVPGWIRDWGIGGRFGLTKLKALVKQRKKKAKTT